MKKLLLTMLLVLGINTIAQQTKSTFIQLHLTTEKHVKTTVQCIDDSITFSDTTNDYILVLHPNKEYYLLFTRDGYISKEIYISTNNINMNNSYNIKLQAYLDKGKSNVIELYGSLVYDTKSDAFIKQKYGN